MASQDEAFDEVQQQQVDDEIIAALLAPSPSRDRARAGRVTDCTSEGSVFARVVREIELGRTPTAREQSSRVGRSPS